MASSTSFPFILKPTSMQGGISTLNETSPLPGGTWYQASDPHDGFVCEFEPGTLAAATHITGDVLVSGSQAVVFGIFLQEGADGPTFLCHFSFLNQCQGRIRMPMEATEQNRWMYPREGAWLKVICGGDRVDLARVDRLKFVCFRKAEGPVKWCMTDLSAVNTEPEKLSTPLLPKGHLLDELGQSTLVDWPGKTTDEEQLIARLQHQLETAAEQSWPDNFSQFGGCTEIQFDSTGFFRTHHDGNRWWLVDPEGYAFWSAGLDCVRCSIDTNAQDLESALKWSPKSDPKFAEACRKFNGDWILNYLQTNLIRAFGTEQWQDNWATLALSLMRRFGFNTVANWSDWEIAAKVGFPYVRPLQWPAPSGPKTPRIFRDLPDVFDPVFAEEATSYAQQLSSTKEDPAFIGYFLMNEPQWGFASMTPAEGILFNCDDGYSRLAMAEFLTSRYNDDRTLAQAWGKGVSFDDIKGGKWTRPLTDIARADMEDFSTILVEKLFSTLTKACHAVDPNHLNLGARYFQAPPKWAINGMGCFDVFSVNGYRPRVDPKLSEACKEMNCPALIGEWHFGALDAGLPASGIGRVHTQIDRGKAYRIYTEDAAAQPWCVGVHYFTFYDQSSLGRYDGENYNIGFVDICHKPYGEITQAARKAHEKIYEIATGRIEPFNDEPEYLERLFY